MCFRTYFITPWKLKRRFVRYFTALLQNVPQHIPASKEHNVQNLKSRKHWYQHKKISILQRQEKQYYLFAVSYIKDKCCRPCRQSQVLGHEMAHPNNINRNTHELTNKTSSVCIPKIDTSRSVHHYKRHLSSTCWHAFAGARQ